MLSFIHNYLKIKKLNKKLKSIENLKILFITGAGVSVNSGILPFRGANGIYKHKPDLKYLLRPDSFDSNPQELYDFHQDFKNNTKNKQPNKLHFLINKFGHKIITQNIDDLFEKAGREDIIHVHGNVSETICRNCSHKTKEDFNLEQECPACEYPMLRHNVVLFKEKLQFMDQVYQSLDECNILIQIGTSGTVCPVADLPRNFKGLKIVINPEKPHNHLLFEHIFIGNPCRLLETLLK